MRLNKFLASCGLGSRRSSETLIQEGRVSVNGKTIESPATFVALETDTVRVDGRVVRPPEKPSYYILNKPTGVVTTAHDPEGRPTVMTLVPASPRVFPVGRLDQESSGLLLLTNDGDLTHRILHPRYRIDKEYEATVEGTLKEETRELLEAGVLLDGEAKRTARATVEITERVPRRTRLRLVIHEGRKRQIRRMLESVGHPVLQLRRVRVGPLTLGKLQPGEYRDLNPAEVSGLRREVQSTNRRGT